MTSVRPPDYHATLEIDPAMYEAISGFFLDVTIEFEGVTSELEGMLAIPEGFRDVDDSGLCVGWLWTDEGRKIELEIKLKITLIRPSEIDTMGRPLDILDPYLGKHLIGYVER